MRCGVHPFPTPVLTGSGSRVDWLLPESQIN
jgi:hypothetical protein